MRNRFRRKDKTIFFFLILLIAILLLGIGYAVIPDIFSIFRTEGKINYANLNVAFVNYQTSGAGTITAEIDKNNPSRASFLITDLKGYHETSTIEYTIQNKENKEVELNITTSSISNQSYFSIDSNIDDLNKTTLKPNETRKLVIHVKVEKVSTEKENIKAKANIIVRANKKD